MLKLLIITKKLLIVGSYAHAYKHTQTPVTCPHTHKLVHDQNEQTYSCTTAYRWLNMNIFLHLTMYTTNKNTNIYTHPHTNQTKVNTTYWWSCPVWSSLRCTWRRHTPECRCLELGSVSGDLSQWDGPHSAWRPCKKGDIRAILIYLFYMGVHKLMTTDNNHIFIIIFEPFIEFQIFFVFVSEMCFHSWTHGWPLRSKDRCPNLSEINK